MRFLASWTACLSLVCLLSPGGAFAATQVVAGPVCGSPQQLCLDFSGQADIPPAILKQAFTAPTGGTAVVSVHGSMQCMNGSTANSSQSGVVDLSAQIVPNNAAVDATGPGGQRFAMRLPPSGAEGYSNAIAISSVRAMTVARGSNTFR